MQEQATYTQLQERIEAHTATIGVIGLGYVGLPLVRAFHSVGFPVLSGASAACLSLHFSVFLTLTFLETPLCCATFLTTKTVSLSLQN